MESHSLISALHAKYSDHEPIHCEIFVPKSAPGKTESGNIRVPTQLVLQCFNIEQAGNPEEVAALCGHIQELDLSHNQLSDWKQVFVMLQQMPHLCVLNLSQNPLGSSTFEAVTGQLFPSVSVLALNDTQVPWSTLSQLLAIFPSLTELHISCNNYQQVELQEGHHSGVKVLHFNSNRVTEWADVCMLGRAFPSLDTLIMVEADIRSLDPAHHIPTTFPNLRSLNLSQGSISSWPELEKLNKFPCLTDIRIQKLPLLEELEEEQRRALVLAYLPRITRLNGSQVEDTERENAERAFIRLFMDQEDKPDRYYELEEQYGKLERLAEVDLQPRDHAKVTVEYQGHEETMYINLNQTVSQLKKSLQNVAKLPVSRMQLYHLEVQLPCGATECKYPKKMLYSLPVRDGDKFFIEERPS